MTTVELKNVFDHTQKIIRSNETLSNATQESCLKNKAYDCEFKVLESRTKNTEFNVVVMEGSTFDTARIFTEGKVAVLNFANPHEPGGGVKRGARA